MVIMLGLAAGLAIGAPLPVLAALGLAVWQPLWTMGAVLAWVALTVRRRDSGTDEVEAALAHFGFRMELKESFLRVSRKERPTVWTWMQKPRNAWAYYILAIHKGKEGHWILVKGVKMCDTFTEGKWTFVVDGPHRGCRIMEVFEVKKSIDS